jgi:hypothetical protein
MESLPHSSHSPVVRGMEGSHIVVIKSTKGTPTGVKVRVITRLKVRN